MTCSSLSDIISDPTRKRAARADRIGEFREPNAEATGGRQVLGNIVIVIVCLLFGTMTTLIWIVDSRFWGIAGRLLIIATGGLSILSERSRVETVAPEDRPMFLRKLRWFFAGLVVLAVGMSLVVTLGDDEDRSRLELDRSPITSWGSPAGRICANC